MVIAPEEKLHEHGPAFSGLAADFWSCPILLATCHAHLCAAVGARTPGQKETLPGGAIELLTRLQGKIGHVHLIDSDNTLHNSGFRAA